MRVVEIAEEVCLQVECGRFEFSPPFSRKLGVGHDNEIWWDVAVVCSVSAEAIVSSQITQGGM